MKKVTYYRPLTKVIFNDANTSRTGLIVRVDLQLTLMQDFAFYTEDGIYLTVKPEDVTVVLN